MRGSRGRWYLLVVALIAVLLVGALAMLGLERAVRVRALEEARIAATGQSAVLAAGLESELNESLS